MLTLKAAPVVVNIGISFNVSIALCSDFVHLCLLSYISPLSSAVGVGFGLVIPSSTVRSDGYPWRSRCSASLA